MSKSNFSLRLQPSLIEEARQAAKRKGITLSQFINTAVAEKLSALRVESYFQERAALADIPGAIKILEHAGKNDSPISGDELRN